MPVNTDLTVPAAGGEGSGFLSNPLGLLSTLTDIRGKQIEQQNLVTQGQIFQQSQQLQLKELAGRAKLGQILSAAPDLATGLSAAYKDPDTAPYAAEQLEQTTRGLSALQEYRGKVQSQAKDGMSAILTAAASAAPGENPDAVESAIQAAGKTIADPAIAARDMGAVRDIVKSWTTGLPSNTPANPTARADEIRSRITHWALVGGFATPAAIDAVYGSPGSVNLQSGVQPTITTPAFGGPMGEAPGSVKYAGPQLTYGLPPTRLEGTAGTSEYPAVPAANVGGPSTPPPDSAGNLANKIPPPSANAGDGKPLVADPKSLVSTQFDRAGRPVIVGPNAEGANERMQKFQGEDLHQYQLAQTGLMRAREMDNALDNLARKGGWQTPGPGGEARNAISALANTFSQITGQELPFDASKVASWEQFNHDSMPAALSILAQNLGQQREAAATIQSTLKTIPTIENTYLGGKLINASMVAMFQRAVDERNYVDYARKVNGGDIQGATEKFNQEHPAESYAESVLNRFGLVQTDRGADFGSVGAVQKAWKNGLLTKEEAKSIANDIVAHPRKVIPNGQQ